MNRVGRFIAALLGLATVTASAQSTPYTPQILEVDCVSDKSVAIAWSIRASASGVIVERAEGTPEFVKIDDIKAGVCDGQTDFNWWDMGVVSGKTYAYRLRAYNTRKGKYTFSGYSNTVTVNVPGACVHSEAQR